MTTPIVKSICRAMERVAPLRLAEKWDNVGLLLEAPMARPNANRVLLTIDLTTAVAEEALSTPTSFIVSYHPTIFKPLSSFTLSNSLQSSLLRCAAAGISIYSPHTALDAVWGGINDWLSTGISNPRGPVISAEETNPAKVDLINEMEALGGIGGIGRVVTLAKPINMKEVERRVKAHLGLRHVQVGYPYDRSPEEETIQSIAICAGSGDSVLNDVPADVYFTGEMSHHTVLAAVARGCFVILCGHTNTERGYLPLLAQRLQTEVQSEATVCDVADPALASALRSLEICVSVADKHPLEFV